MISLTPDFRQKIADALHEQRANYGGTDAQYAKQYDINGSIYSRLKGGEELEGLLRDSKWIEIGQRLDVNPYQRQWKMVNTEVHSNIMASAKMCQDNARSFMLVDDAGIGKSYSGKFLSRTLKNCFLIDGSQAKGKTEFIRLFARTLGVDDKMKIVAIKAKIKYILKVLPHPLVIIDEAGDLDDKTFLEIKEIWNATEGLCGWFMMGAEGLEEKVQRNINNKKPGFAETFSRFGERYNHIVPLGREEKTAFMRTLLTDVVAANITNKSLTKEIVNRCLKNDTGRISGLRRAETLILLKDTQKTA